MDLPETGCIEHGNGVQPRVNFAEIPLITAFAIAIVAQAVLPCTRMAQPKQPLAKWILIVEDDPVQARVYGQYLKKAGYTVLVATDGPTGAKQAVDLKPDGVLLDIMLPGMSGVDVLRQIREKRPDLPVVMYTNGFVPMMLDKAMAAGATSVFNKLNLTAHELAHAFNELLLHKAA